MRRFLLTSLTLTCLTAALTTNIHAKGKEDAEVVQAITKLENEWGTAYKTGDVATLDKIQADDFLLVDPSGKLSTKADDLRDVKSGTSKWSDVKMEDLKVRVYGKTAIASGVLTIKGTYAGKDVTGKYRFTDVFVKKKDNWKAVSGHVTALAAKP